MYEEILESPLLHCILYKLRVFSRLVSLKKSLAWCISVFAFIVSNTIPKQNMSVYPSFP